MKIAILDSGLDASYCKDSSIIGGCTLQYMNDEIVCMENEYIDDNGHGTKTFQIIKQYGSSENKYYIVKILDKNSETTVETLIYALQCMMNRDIDIIHLSLSIVKQNFDGLKDLLHICHELSEKEVVLICAQKNKTNIPLYPAAIDSVLGVNSIYTQKFEEIWYDSREIIQCYCNAVPKLVKGLNERYDFYGGTSKSAAVVTGILSRNMELCGDKDVHKILYGLAMRHNWRLNSDIVCAKKFRRINFENSIQKKYPNEKYIIVQNALHNVIGIENEIDFFRPLSNQNIILDGVKTKKLLDLLQKEFSTMIDFEDIFYTSVYSFNSILDLFV